MKTILKTERQPMQHKSYNHSSSNVVSASRLDAARLSKNHTPVTTKNQVDYFIYTANELVSREWKIFLVILGCVISTTLSMIFLGV